MRPPKAELNKYHPTLFCDITWLAAREEQFLDGHLLNVGRSSTLERTAYLMLHLFNAYPRGQAGDRQFSCSSNNQEHLPDTFGMLIVGANKHCASCMSLDSRSEQLEGVAHCEPKIPQMRPLI